MAELTLAFSLAMVVSLFVAVCLVATRRWHSRWSADAPGAGPQKIHLTSIPRIGGLAIAAGLFVALVEVKFASSLGERLPSPLSVIAALSVPLLVGLWEDLTRVVGPWMRLFATFVAAAIAFVFCGAQITRFDMPLLDAMLATTVIAPFLFTLFCVGGVAHSFNLADGLNGLLGGVATVGALLIATVAMRYGDLYVAVFAASLAGATVGFLLLNFPRAALFAGDSGAYLLGTTIAFLAIWLAARNPAVSPWLAFIAVLYPFTDTTFAIARRLAQRKPVMAPDAEHLHSLLARALQKRVGNKSNALAAMCIVTVSAAFAFAAYYIATSSTHLIVMCSLFGVGYVIAWFALAPQRTPSSESQIQAASRLH